ncbi:hypothetical protein CLV51_103333 [Chitinophaga niastensis]|uniref:DinB family protein n=1 Tax=Chitinophaga niastensis TaxID=536980 RepID=A0A2P8HJG9_CHINA|nr:damage-inducible protein DinB [Chitinophaga niastensis]PSL46355.1 hypothetical protein CLV51_103333 [Chitinophaga niastensis]
MDKIYRQGAVGALLDEYEKAISELQICIADISDHDLEKVVDTTTTNPDCKSVQTILTHVVSSAHSYAIYIQTSSGDSALRPAKVLHTTVQAYIKGLADAFIFTTTVFKDIKDADLEQFDDAQKMHTNWGQVYDIEQMMEHAIVHILRHRRQIERFKIALHKL